MRRVILAVTGTIAGLVALLSFKSHAPALPVAATSGTGGGSSPSSPSSVSPASSPPSPSSVPGESPTGSQAGNLPAGESAVTGRVADTAYGPVQVQLIVKSGSIVKVAVLEQPTNT